MRGWATAIVAGPANECGPGADIPGDDRQRRPVLGAAGDRRDGDADLHAGGERQRVGDGDGPAAGQRRHGERRRGHQSAPQTFTITVTAVNDAPVLDNTGNMALGTILEDQVGNNGTLVTDLIASAGGDRITDVDAGAVEGIAITAADTASGAWQYSLTTMAGPGTRARLSFGDDGAAAGFRREHAGCGFGLPASNFNGTIATALTFRAWDQTTGASGRTAWTHTERRVYCIQHGHRDRGDHGQTSGQRRPGLGQLGDMNLGTILEDATANAGTLVTDLIASAGGDRITRRGRRGSRRDRGCRGGNRERVVGVFAE